MLRADRVVSPADTPSSRTLTQFQRLYKCTAVFHIHLVLCIRWLLDFLIIFTFPKVRRKITTNELVSEEHQILIILCSYCWAKIIPWCINIYTTFTGLTGEGWLKGAWYRLPLWKRTLNKPIQKTYFIFNLF